MDRKMDGWSLPLKSCPCLSLFDIIHSVTLPFISVLIDTACDLPFTRLFTHTVIYTSEYVDVVSNHLQVRPLGFESHSLVLISRLCHVFQAS